MIGKPINPWLYSALSLIPFFGYYPFLKLKKTRRIFLINIPIGIVNIVVLLFLNPMLGQFMTWTITPTVDAIFIFHWVTIHNQRLSSFQ